MKETGRLLLWLSGIIAFSILQLHGQELQLNELRMLDMRNTGPRDYGDIEGSPYYTDKFIECVIYLKDGTFISEPLRYDLYQDQMEFMKDDKPLWLIKDDINFIRYGNDTILVSSVGGDSTKLAYFFLKDEGDVMLFYKKTVSYQPRIPPKGYSDAIPERFVPDRNLVYIKKGKMPTMKILTRKDLASVFSDNERALEFIKKNKVKHDDIEALHRLVSFINKN